MFRITANRFPMLLRGFVGLPKQLSSVRTSGSHGPSECEAEFDARYEAFFNRPDIDHWEARKAMNDLLGMDLVPEPKIIIAALKACRRLNDYALAIRFLEAVGDRCGNKKAEIYPYLLQEIRPTLCDLGIDTPEELGYDKPELALKTAFDVEP
ncbi:cytochrome c oxidase subunit 5A, mitochondrial-like [Toxorhynchites rutilus septentrionalis]|uniref:cytochrome c oxidase subunit 5A, mitochondrial-like n=1 Tax=Toxorhynchites rutilus septentrionalis TaxID=329112 RepID=UPI00247A375D|nr:cytochrome c oxidase subunit 5A, mitochondrial-like [Toxorhynchites rutilus septentrionalis]